MLTVHVKRVLPADGQEGKYVHRPITIVAFLLAVSNMTSVSRLDWQVCSVMLARCSFGLQSVAEQVTYL